VPVYKYSFKSLKVIPFDEVSAKSPDEVRLAALIATFANHPLGISTGASIAN
jgi:hypothetical protein